MKVPPVGRGIALLGTIVFGTSFALLAAALLLGAAATPLLVLSAAVCGICFVALAQQLVARPVAPPAQLPATELSHAEPPVDAPTTPEPVAAVEPATAPEPAPPSYADVTVQVLQARGFEQMAAAGAWAQPGLRLVARTNDAGTHVVCVVDAQRNEAIRFGLLPAQLAEATALLPRGAKTLVELVEVRQTVLEADQFRLEPLKLKKGGLTFRAYLVDEHRGIVGSNASSTPDHTRTFLTRLLREGPWVGEQLLALETKVAGQASEGLPWVTLGLMAMLALGFALELLFAVEPITGTANPGGGSLVALGGLLPSVMNQFTDGYRLWMPLLLHGDVVHLLLNGAALWMAGVILERLVGRRWTLALFLVGGLGGSVLSWTLSAKNVVSVGASGAIMAMLAAAFVASSRMWDAAERQQVQGLLARVLVPSLLPMIAVGGSKGVDIFAHLGGAVTGGLLGALLLAVWPVGEARPRGRRIAGGIATLGALCLAGSVAQASREYPEIALQYELMPNDQAPHDDEGVAKAAELLQRYPDDPRVRRYVALGRLRAGDWAAAETGFKDVLADRRRLAAFKPVFEQLLTGELAFALIKQDKTDEAIARVAAFCRPPAGEKVFRTIEVLGLCPLEEEPAVEQAPLSPPELARARDLSRTALEAHRAGRFAEAVPTFKESIALWRRDPAFEIATAQDRISLAASYRQLADYGNAIPLLEKTVGTLAASKAAEAPALHRGALNNLATAYWSAGRVKQSQRTWQSALALHGAERTEDKATVLDHLAMAAVETKDLEAAERYSKEGLALWTELSGKENADVAISMSGLANVELSRNKLPEARALLKDAARILELRLGTTHPNLGSILNLQARVEAAAGDAALARQYYQRSISLCRETLGENHPQVREAVDGLALLEKK